MFKPCVVWECVCALFVCIISHLLTMTPYLTDLAVRLSGFHHTLISEQQTHTQSHVQPNAHTYKQTHSVISRFSLSVCMYCKSRNI